MNTGAAEPYENDPSQRIAYLVAGYLRKTLTPTEHDELDEWVTASDRNQRLFEELVTPSIVAHNLKRYDEADEEAALRKLKSQIQFNEPKVNKGSSRLLRYGIAASVVLIVGIAITYQLMKKPVATESTTALLQPGGNRAVLILNGRTVNLDEVKNGLIESGNGSEILKTADGVISYEKIGENTSAINMHELRTPAGGQYQVKLPDGSMVWLNAASKLRYPNVFSGNERVVELEGEGYFEITNRLLRDARNDGEEKVGVGGEGEIGKVPFIVKLRDGAMVKVTGTHFNVTAYANEAEIKTTLLEGSVIVECERVRKDGKTFKTMASPSPGSQAVVRADGDVNVVENTNVAEVIAWKNGQFKFKDAPIDEIMRQVARWYDAEVVYAGKVDYHFNATIERDEPLKKLLELLEKTKRVRFEVEGRKVRVGP